MSTLENYATATEAIDAILNRAATMKASDIHIDPRAGDIMIRLRVDGMLEHSGLIPKRLHEEIIARLKILSGARTDLHALPQDGRWKEDIIGLPYNLRVSFMPAYHGENAVIRLLPVRLGGEISFAKLGFTPEHVCSIDNAIRSNHGLILVVGPTGSGKTTTLHACLSLKAKEALSVITLEDPIEYEIPGVRQIHIRHTHGVTFASGLRASLRQDPDVIMVGEIRDSETARVAIHTALTGHLVFSTLHTNSALETLPRLTDMGIDPYLIASTLRLVIGQRLIRSMCRDCFSAGCETCRKTGYIGRSVLAETLDVDNEFRELITRKEPLDVCGKYVLSRGFKSISDDAAEKVDWGITTREEVTRVLNC